jgi:hypothetical protein
MMVFITTRTQLSITDDVRVDGCGSRAWRGWRVEGGSVRSDLAGAGREKA